MSLRAIFLLLLAANLAFLGWAELIDVPAEPPQDDSISHLPRLELLSEVHVQASSSRRAAAPAESGTSVSASQGAAPAALGAETSLRAAESVVTASKSADTTAQSTAGKAAESTAGIAAESTAGIATSGSGGASGAAPRGITTSAGIAAVRGLAADPAGHRCITVGPFADPEHAKEASDLLRERGFSPRQRLAPSGPPRGYWVFVGRLKSASDEASVLRRLETNGISDAKVMPVSDTDRRVSVGLFSALDGAERRARAVRRLGLDAEIEPRPVEAAHWVDVDLNASSQSLPAEGLLALEEVGSKLEIKECPASAGMAVR